MTLKQLLMTSLVSLFFAGSAFAGEYKLESAPEADQALEALEAEATEAIEEATEEAEAAATEELEPVAE